MSNLSDKCNGNKPCYFALLGLKPHFNIDLIDLTKRYKERISAVHPDRFASATEREKRLALEQSANLNEAYQHLKLPSKRAHYLLSLKGTSLPLETTVQDPEFLMQQMHWHEELENLNDSPSLSAIETFKQNIQKIQSQLEQDFSDCWQDSNHFKQAEQLMRRMQFLDKLLLNIKQLEERLDDE